MPSRPAVLIGSLALATATTGIGVGAAHASSTTTSLHLSAVLAPSAKVATGYYDAVGTLTHRKGSAHSKPVGYVTYACTAASAAVLHCNAAFALSGGILLTRETLDFTKAVTKGVITGGDGKYAGVRGTLRQETGKSGVMLVDLTFVKK